MTILEPSVKMTKSAKEMKSWGPKEAFPANG